MRRPLLAILAAVAAALALVPGAAPAATAKPKPGSAAYEIADVENVAAAYGRITGPGGQLRNPAYLPALVGTGAVTQISDLLEQAATPNRLALTPGEVVPGWNVGNPLRAGWNGTRGLMTKVAFTNRYGALLRGHVYRPLPGARDPYTHQRLRGPYPGVIITPGSVQGSERMYEWLAEDLAERGYVTMTFDVQGEGRSETLPHEGPVDALPFCNPFAPPRSGEMDGCPGVPFQQLSNFVVGTEDALAFFTSTPARHYGNPHSGDVPTSAYNPYWRLFDRSPDRRTATPGRTTRIAIVGHSMGAAAVSKVQGISKRVEAVVALDKLTGPDSPPPLDGTGNKPVVPALAVQSEYGFTVTPWQLSGGSSLNPEPSPQGPDPARERRTGYDAWQRAGKDTMLVVPRASTHLDYTDIPLVLPASRYGQDVASVYVQRWLGRYLKHDVSVTGLLDTTLRYLEPTGHGVWRPVTLHRDSQLSRRYCSAYSLHAATGWRRNADVTGAGCD